MTDQEKTIAKELIEELAEGLEYTDYPIIFSIQTKSPTDITRGMYYFAIREEYSKDFRWAKEIIEALRSLPNLDYTFLFNSLLYKVEMLIY